MKARLAVLFFLVAFARAQQFQHVVIVVQENRTPDNFCQMAPAGADVSCSGSAIPLGTGYDPDHTHSAFLAEAAGTFPTQTVAYVQASDLAPYTAIAAQYGWADRMFQTNQGPSTPAHQFIFSGTSAPREFSDLFESENQSGGCLGTSAVQFIDPTGNENHFGSTCLEHPTLTDLLDAAALSWRYYGTLTESYWVAPEAIEHICVPSRSPAAPPPGSGHGLPQDDPICTGTDWANDVDLNPPDVLTDIANGNLANVSWVTPAGSYSDHAGYGSGGPSWVASIVNAIGQSNYWQDTAILIFWDDWGGWFDHVAPMQSTWAPWYVGGFRVPLLVVSAETPAMISGTQHDFGSILRFVEQNFSLGFIAPGDYADAETGTDDLSEFFSGAPHSFTKIKARPLTKAELASNDAPDTD